MVDNALRKCDADEGEFLAVLCNCELKHSLSLLILLISLLQVGALHPPGRCECPRVCVSCCPVSSCRRGPVPGSILLTDTQGSTTQTLRWLSTTTAWEPTSVHARYRNFVSTYSDDRKSMIQAMHYDGKKEGSIEGRRDKGQKEGKILVIFYGNNMYCI